MRTDTNIGKIMAKIFASIHSAFIDWTIYVFVIFIIPFGCFTLRPSTLKLSNINYENGLVDKAVSKIHPGFKFNLWVKWLMKKKMVLGVKCQEMRTAFPPESDKVFCSIFPEVYQMQQKPQESWNIMRKQKEKRNRFVRLNV